MQIEAKSVSILWQDKDYFFTFTTEEGKYHKVKVSLAQLVVLLKQSMDIVYIKSIGVF